MNAKILTIFLLLSVVTIGIFGGFGINMMPEGAHPCPISKILGGDCPPSDNPMAQFSHHISGLQHFLQFTINFNLTSLLISSLLFLWFLYVVLKKPKYAEKGLIYKKIKREENPNINENRKILRWLALRNKRDYHTLFYGV